MFIAYCSRLERNQREQRANQRSALPFLRLIGKRRHYFSRAGYRPLLYRFAVAVFYYSQGSDGLTYLSKKSLAHFLIKLTLIINNFIEQPLFIKPKFTWKERQKYKFSSSFVILVLQVYIREVESWLMWRVVIFEN